MDLCVLGAHWRTLWHRYNDHCQSTTSVICLCILRSDCHNTASSNSQPSCTHSAPLTECPDENALPLHDSPCQDFWKELEVSVGSVCSITCNSPVSGRTQADAELLYCMQETCGCPESFAEPLEHPPSFKLGYWESLFETLILQNQLDLQTCK